MGEEAALMGRYCDGDASAFHELYRATAPRLFAYLLGLIGERPTAEDLLQQTFLKVHESRDVYVRGADPLPWLYTIAHRTCLDELRRRKRARVTLTADGALPVDASAPAAERPEGALSRATQAALERLPHNQREALILTKVHGRSLEEAAAIAGTTPGAIKLRAHRAYVALRRLLERTET
jgi:RNA polymerase sigma-70 factor (ECF subfamily)